MWCFAYQKEEKTKNEITERNILLVFVIYKDIWCISIYLTNFPLTCFRLHGSMISREGLWTTLSWSFWLILQRSGHYSTCSVPTIIYSVTFVIVTLYHMNIICFDYNVLCRFRNLLSRFAQSHYVVCTMRQHITVYTAT